MGKRITELKERLLEKQPFRFVYLMVRRYLDHQVGLQSAALAFYLLFAIFPFLIFISALLGLLQLNIEAVLQIIGELLPGGVVEIAKRYLNYVSANPSRRLMVFGLVFSVWFPMRATNTLLRSVRTAYRLGPPRGAVLHVIKTFLYSVLLIVSIGLTVTLMTVSNRAVLYAVTELRLPPVIAEVWARSRFPLIALVGCAALFFLYASAQDGPRPLSELLPGTVAALAAWMGFSWMYAWYVDHIAHYSVLYGSIGTVIVLMVWLSLGGQVLIMGAEFNGVLADLRLERAGAAER